jgi:predicted Zn-dependent peptidase
MGVWVDVGARDESEEQSGLSHFIEHMIFKGTARRSAYQIAKEFDAIGGHTNAFTSMENTCYHARVMDEHLDTMVEILSDIFLNSVFDTEEVDRERPVIFQEIGMVEDTPEEYIHLLSGNNFWGDHPLGRSILGTRENILGFNSNTIKAFFRRFYHPERIVISLAGNVAHQKIVDMLGPTFETIKAGDDLPRRITPRLQPTTMTHNRPLEQVHICLAALGLSVTDPRRFALSLLNTIIGGSMSSRLFQEIREKRGLAYSIYSFTTAHVDTGMFGVYTGVASENVHQTLDMILRLISQLRDAPVSMDELHDAKAYTKGNLFLSAESVDNQMVRLAQNEIHFDEFVTVEKVVEKIETVTAEEILSLANELFTPDQISLTLLGPCDQEMPLDTLIARHFK